MIGRACDMVWRNIHSRWLGRPGGSTSITKDLFRRTLRLIKVHLFQTFLPYRLPFRRESLLEQHNLLFNVLQRLVSLAVTQLVHFDVCSFISEMHNLLTDLVLERPRNEITLYAIIPGGEGSRVNRALFIVRKKLHEIAGMDVKRLDLCVATKPRARPSA